MATNMYMKFTEPEVKGSSTAGEQQFTARPCRRWGHGWAPFAWRCHDGSRPPLAAGRCTDWSIDPLDRKR